MSGQIEIPFAIGQTVWRAAIEPVTTYLECPDCCGKKKVTVTQGNGEVYTLDCRCCQTGYDSPTGRIQRTEWKSVPTEVTLRRVDISGNEIRYSDSPPGSCSYRIYNVEDMFLTKEAAQVRSEELNAKQTAYEAERFINNMASKKKDLAWSVHYWSRLAATKEKEIEEIYARLGRCREKEAKKKKKESA
jgi:hypothetical protein